MKKLKGAESELEKRVQNILNDMVCKTYTIKQILQNLLKSGCVSGMIDELVYYNDTEEWFEIYKDEINELLKETMFNFEYSFVSIFGKNFDTEDPLCLEQKNRNLLAWFSFEETARILAEKNNIEI